jgi:hypothetical protein
MAMQQRSPRAKAWLDVSVLATSGAAVLYFTISNGNRDWLWLAAAALGLGAWSLWRLVRPVPSLESRLENLRACGIELAPGFSIEDVRRSGDRQVDGSAYLGTALTLGDTTEHPPFKPLSHDLWHFDVECIEDHGSYKEIAVRLRDLAGGELAIADITDFVDIESGVARLSFTLDGKQHDWNLRVNNDYVDEAVFDRFIAFLAERNARKRYTYLGLGQDCLIGCATEEQLKQLRQRTGLKFEWLKPSRIA